MTDLEAEMAVKSQVLVGTNNVAGKAGLCLFSTGHLIREVKVKGSGQKQFLFRDYWGEIEVVRPASAFYFVDRQ